VIAMLVTPHDDAHALHSYDSALASRSALVLALRLGVFVSLAFLCPPQISVSPSSFPRSLAAIVPFSRDDSLFTPTARLLDAPSRPARLEARARG
tara:strand:- start:6 stop:290 length:285 start_codon:yes stop_codon:yes gene_type:complete